MMTSKLPTPPDMGFSQPFQAGMFCRSGVDIPTDNGMMSEGFLGDGFTVHDVRVSFSGLAGQIDRSAGLNVSEFTTCGLWEDSNFDGTANQIDMNGHSFDVRSYFSNPIVVQLFQQFIKNGFFQFAPDLARRFFRELKALVRIGLSTDELHHKIQSSFSACDLELKHRVQERLKDEEKRRAEFRAQQILSFLPENEKPQSYLDLGCGPGDITAAMSRRLGLDKTTARGVDVISGANDEDFSFIRFDGVNLPIADNSQEFLTAMMMLHHVENLDGLLKEAWRVTAPGGYLIIREHDCRHRDIGEFNSFMDHMWYQVFSDASNVPINDHYYSSEEWRDIIEEYGFRMLNFQRVEPGNPFHPFFMVFQKPE